MDIHSKAPYPAGMLSNFAPHRFTFDAVRCASMEGLLQSFKFPDPATQVRICGLPGPRAKNEGSKGEWRTAQELWWAGTSYARSGPAYQALLDRAFEALFTNSRFRRALLATGDETLTHVRGKSDISVTVLTADELCSRLEALRVRAKGHDGPRRQA